MGIAAEAILNGPAILNRPNGDGLTVDHPSSNALLLMENANLRKQIEIKDSIISALKDGREMLHEVIRNLVAENVEQQKRLATVLELCDKGLEDHFKENES